MSNTYTPGPWNASRNQYQGLVISEATGANVAVTYDVKDAYLVAAAPEILEILERILRAHQSGNNGAYMGEAVLCRMFEDMAYQAINKAKGL